jgi:hypothetical protein
VAPYEEKLSEASVLKRISQENSGAAVQLASAEGLARAHASIHSSRTAAAAWYNTGVLYELWKSRGAEFITEPIPKYGEIGCYIRDPDGYIIEVGQSTDQVYG